MHWLGKIYEFDVFFTGEDKRTETEIRKKVDKVVVGL